MAKTKIWKLKTSYKTRFYKTEAAFLAAVRDNDTRAEVTIFEEIEPTQNAAEYKKNHLMQRGREEQLSVILDNNSEVSTVLRIKEILSEIQGNWTAARIVRLLESKGMSAKSFKSLVSAYRTFFLYKGPNSVEWYKLILQLHNFKFEEELISYNKTTKIDESRVNNFKQAKEELKKEKKQLSKA